MVAAPLVNGVNLLPFAMQSKHHHRNHPRQGAGQPSLLSVNVCFCVPILPRQLLMCTRWGLGLCWFDFGRSEWHVLQYYEEGGGTDKSLSIRYSTVCTVWHGDDKWGHTSPCSAALSVGVELMTCDEGCGACQPNRPITSLPNEDRPTMSSAWAAARSTGNNPVEYLRDL